MECNLVWISTFFYFFKATNCTHLTGLSNFVNFENFTHTYLHQIVLELMLLLIDMKEGSQIVKTDKILTAHTSYL